MKLEPPITVTRAGIALQMLAPSILCTDCVLKYVMLLGCKAARVQTHRYREYFFQSRDSSGWPPILHPLMATRSLESRL